MAVCFIGRPLSNRIRSAWCKNTIYLQNIIHQFMQMNYNIMQIIHTYNMLRKYQVSNRDWVFTELQSKIIILFHLGMYNYSWSLIEPNAVFLELVILTLSDSYVRAANGGMPEDVECDRMPSPRIYLLDTLSQMKVWFLSWKDTPKQHEITWNVLSYIELRVYVALWFWN